MPTLYLTDEQYQILEHESQKMGVSCNEYAIARLFPRKNKPTTLKDLLCGVEINSFQGDPVAIQKELRNEWD